MIITVPALFDFACEIQATFAGSDCLSIKFMTDMLSVGFV